MHAVCACVYRSKWYVFQMVWLRPQRAMFTRCDSRLHLSLGKPTAMCAGVVSPIEHLFLCKTNLLGINK